MKHFLSDIAIWTGAVLGLLKILDWLLRDPAKQWITEKAESAWIWLADQRAGKFTFLLKHKRVQIGFSIFAHAIMILISFLYLARLYLGWEVDASLQLGHPRLYPEQLWIELLALIISATIISWKIHPMLTTWIANTSSLWKYFGRSISVLIVTFVLLFLLITGFGTDFGNSWLGISIGMGSSDISFANEAEIAVYEDRLGGKASVIVVHAINSVCGAAVIVQMMLVQSIVFLSLYWLILVWIAMAFFRAAQFVLIRIVEHPKSPVLALSGLLVGIGAIVKAFV